MPAERMTFETDIAIVTGAGRGLGRVYALALAERGAKVVVNDLDAEAAQSVVDEITTGGGEAVADSHSVAERDGAERIVATAVDSYGRLTIVVNNAGVISYAPFGELKDDQWELMKSVTLDGTYNVCKAAWPIFKTNGHGRIVNVTSNAGFAGSATLSHYGTAKLGILGLTKNLAIEGAELGIAANAVAPMAVTRMNAEAFFGNSDPDEDTWQEDIESGKVPMGPASIVAPTVVWLSHRDTVVSGEVFSASSGKVARVAVVVGDGYFNPNHTAEDLRENVDTVRSIQSYVEPLSTEDELALIPPLFQKQ